MNYKILVITLLFPLTLTAMEQGSSSLTTHDYYAVKIDVSFSDAAIASQTINAR